mgnify:CR=1 FL=1
MEYSELTDKEKKKFITDNYIKNKLSFAEIAKIAGTYSNKIRRDANKFGINIRNRSQAAKIALNQVWDSLDKKEREKRSEIGKESWNKKSEAEKREVIEKGGQAIREASRIGSKLERYILEELIKLNYNVQFHREHVLRNHRLEIDLYVTDLQTAIEIDGPSHFEPVWGEENLIRNQRSDKQKTGLIISQGMILIRIKQDKRISQRYFRNIFNKLVAELEKIKTNFPEKDKRYIEI